MSNWIENTVENVSIEPAMGQMVEVQLRDGDPEPDTFYGRCIKPRKLWVELENYYTIGPDDTGKFIADENTIARWRPKES